MVALRRHRQRWVVAWLIVQVASLSAFVAQDCCATHRVAASVEERGCHQNAAAAKCPMRAADGTPCPMHRNQTGDERASDHCTLRGRCNEPMATLLAQLANVGVLVDPIAVPADDRAVAAVATPGENLIARFAAPDTPPPRA